MIQLRSVRKNISALRDQLKYFEQEELSVLKTQWFLVLLYY